MTGKWLAILVFLLGATAAFGQAEADGPGKISNDRPDRPLQMPPASTEVREAFDDFDRFSRRGAWERALKALDAIPEAQDGRFVDGPDGFIIPVARKRRALIVALPPEGLSAYRLFHDSDAKKKLDEAEGADERKALERVYSAYFLTAVGDEAADRLGGLDFEAGRFDRAAECWLAVLRDYPDSDLPASRTVVKAALALARAGRWSEFDELRGEWADRFPDEEVSLGGQPATVVAHLDRIAGRQASGDAASSSEPAQAAPDLARAVPSAWQMRFGDSVTAGMSEQELAQWRSNPLSGAVPAAAVAGGRFFANYVGHLFALDLETGKLLWRSASFHNLDAAAQQGQARMLDPSRFTIVASGQHVWALTRPLNDVNQNMYAPLGLTCLRADTGDQVWRSTDLPDYSDVELVGQPVFAEGTLYSAGKTPMNMRQQGQNRQYVVAVRPRDGKVLWKTEVGTFRQGERYYYYGMGDTSPQAKLACVAGSVYIDTHAGVLAKLDAGTGEIDWGFAYPADPIQSSGRMIFFNGMPQTSAADTAGSAPIRSGGALIAKGAKSERLQAIDPDRMKLLWDRPLSKSDRLLAADDRAIYLGGPELSAFDRESKQLLWATHLPGGSGSARVLARPDGIWQLTPRGVFEVDPATGDVRRVFRGDDAGSDGGDLYLTDHWLLAVTDRAITAYPKGAEGGPIKEGE